MFIFFPEINSQHSMLSLHQENDDLLSDKWKESISIRYVIIFGHSQQFCHYCIYGSYIHNEMSVFPILHGSISDSTIQEMISEIRVSINLTILQLIFILWESKNSQHEMLDNRENKKTICYQERLFPQKYDGGLIQNTYTYLHEYIKSYITLVTTNLLMKSCNYMG